MKSLVKNQTGTGIMKLYERTKVLEAKNEHRNGMAKLRGSAVGCGCEEQGTRCGFEHEESAASRGGRTCANLVRLNGSVMCLPRFLCNLTL